MSTMRAALFDRYGTPDVLRIGALPVPVPGEGEVLVRVRAASVNGGEIAGRRGDLRLVTGRRFPKQTGIDFVGDVIGGDETATIGLLGRSVWGAIDERGDVGSMTQYLVTTPEHLAVAPPHLAAAEAASLLAGGTTALQGLREVAHLRPKEHLLIRGASGGVGSIAVQIGKILGAHVTGLSNVRATEFVRGLGADEVIDYHTPIDQLGTFDVIFDTRGTDLGRLRRRLASGGRLVTTAFDLEHPVRSLMIIGGSAVFGVRRIRLFLGHPTSSSFAELTALSERGLLVPVVDKVFPLSEIAAAHAALERGGVMGKVVVDMDIPEQTQPGTD